MHKTGTEQHFFTVRGRGFDHKQWKAVTELSQGIVTRAKEAGISADFEADARRILITSSEDGVSPLVIWRKGEPGIPKEVTTRGNYDKLVQSILTAAKKVAPDIFEMTSPDGRDYRRLLAKSNGGELPEVKEIAQKNKADKDRAFLQSVRRQHWVHPETKNQVEFVSLPKKEQTSIRHRWDAEYGKRFDQAAKVRMDKLRAQEKAKTEAKRKKEKAQDAAKEFKTKAEPRKAMTMTEDSIRKAAIRVAASTEDQNLKLALLEILRDTADETPKQAEEKEAKAKKSEEKGGRHEEGKSVDVGDYLKEKGHGEDSAKWEKHEGDMGKKSSAGVVFPEVYEMAWRHVIDFSRKNADSKTASGSTAQRVEAATQLAKKWVQEAIARQATIAATVPSDKLDQFIEKVRSKGDRGLLVACLVAKRLQPVAKEAASIVTAKNFPVIFGLATEQVTAFLSSQDEGKTAAMTSEVKDAMVMKLAKKWIQDAIKRPGRVHEYLGVPEGDDIPVSKIDSAIEKVKGTGNKSLLSALELAKRLKSMNKKKAEQAAA